MTLTELDELKKNNPERFWSYYYWIKHLKLTESRKISDMEHNMQKEKNKRKGTTVSFPNDFVSVINNKVVNLE